LKKIFLSFFLFSFLYLPAQKPYKIIAYYTGNGESIKQWPVNKLTHIIYSFLRIRNDSLSFHHEKQENSLRQIVDLKKVYPTLKVMVSIGGWGGCSFCSSMFSSAARRKTFIETTISLFRKYGIDGLDLDWEYPAIEGYPGHAYTPEDKNNFTLLVKEMRQKMGNDFMLTFAAGGFVQYLEESIDWDQLINV
jgi:chitinase